MQKEALRRRELRAASGLKRSGGKDYLEETTAANRRTLFKNKSSVLAVALFPDGASLKPARSICFTAA